jgi:two-component system osmolarity sensor histidine kinase EnvZ
MILLVPAMLLQIAVGVIFFERHWTSVSQRLSASLAGDIALIIAQLGPRPDSAKIQALRATLTPATELEIHWTPLARLNRSGVPRNGIETRLEAQLAARIDHPRRYATFPDAKTMRIDIGLGVGVLTVITPLGRLTSSTTYLFIIWTLGATLTLFAVAIVFMRNQVRPISRLAIAAEAFGRGGDLAIERIEGADEVRQATLAFVRMRRQIRRQMAEQAAFLAGVSHDLRTPLTRMKLTLALLPDDPDVVALRADVAAMQRMIGAYLAYSCDDQSSVPEPVVLDHLLTQISADTRRSGAVIQTAIAETATIQGRPVALERALVNLVENATRHATAVWLSLAVGQRHVEIHVDDDGPGIAEAQREKALRPFVRLDEARDPESGGVGLGLAITADVARQHGGRFVLADSPHGGLRATLVLPLSQG